MHIVHGRRVGEMYVVCDILCVVCICGVCVIYLSIWYLCSFICIICVYNELCGLRVAWCVSVVCDMCCIVLGMHMYYV